MQGEAVKKTAGLFNIIPAWRPELAGHDIARKMQAFREVMPIFLN
jgi:hypothetical protein